MAVETVVERAAVSQPAPTPVQFTLNGTAIVGRADESLIDAATRHGIEVPHLCYKEGMRPDGNCRTCMVEIKGERVLAPSCCRYPTDGMEVTTDSTRAVTSQKMVLELLLSDVPETSYTLNSELDLWARRLSVGKTPSQPGIARARRLAPAIAVNSTPLSAAAACACPRTFACSGPASGRDSIVFDSTIRWRNQCVACGEMRP